MTTTAPLHPPRTLAQRVGYLARRAVHMEINVWRSLYRFVFRRPKVPPGASAFGYHQPVLSILIVFMVVSAVELVVVDLIVHRWTYIRIPLLILGIWGLTWMTGMLFGFLTRPHAVGPEGIRARYTADIDVPLPWDDVQSVARKKRTVEPRTPKLGATDSGAVLTLHIQHETNIDIELEHPVQVRLPQGRVPVTEVRLYADDPKAFMDAVRRHI